jgi:hypothetical protein
MLLQLFGCLMLKEFLRLDYRTLSTLFEDAPELAALIDLDYVPHLEACHQRNALWPPRLGELYGQATGS